MVKLLIACTIKLIFFNGTEIQCNNGDVWLEDDGTPLFFWNDKLSPICGKWFWNNQIGATLFCQKLKNLHSIILVEKHF